MCIPSVSIGTQGFADTVFSVFLCRGRWYAIINNKSVGKSVVGENANEGTNEIIKDEEGKKVVRKLVDTETGEVITVREGDRLSVVSPEQREAIQKSYNTYFLNDEIRNWNEGLGGFVFVLYKYSDMILNEHDDITPEDITKLFYLATYVNFEGYLMYNSKYMTRKVMQRILKISKNRFGEFYRKLRKCKILLEEGKKIKVNTDYFRKGSIGKLKDNQYGYIRTYIDSIRYLYESVPIRSQRQLGIYFKIIPFIHRQQNIVCHNPNCDLADIQPMTIAKIKEEIGYHRNSVRKLIKDLLSIKLDNEESILGLFRTEYDEGASYIIINPRVMYGGNFDLKNGKYSITKLFKPNKLLR